MFPYPGPQDPMSMELNRLLYLVEQLSKERDDLRTAVAIHERIIEVMAMGLRSSGLTGNAETANQSREDITVLERRITALEHQLDEVMALFKGPEEDLNGEPRLKPALVVLSKAFKNFLCLNKQKDPEPASAAPVAEWKEEGNQEDRTTCASRPVLEVKEYFKPPPTPRLVPVERVARPAGPSRPQQSSLHPEIRNKQFFAAQTWRPHPKLSYRDLDVPSVPSFGGPIPGSANPTPTNWSDLYSTDTPAPAGNVRIWAHHDFSHRTVIVDPITKTADLYTLIRKLHSGYFIESIHRAPSARVSGHDLVKINFLSTDDAYEYVQLANIKDDLTEVPGASRAVVKHSETPTGPLSRYVQDAIFVHGATRILVVDSLPPALRGPREIRLQLELIFDRSLRALLKDPEFGDGSVRITFRAVGDAYRAANRWRKTTDPLWRGVKIWFAFDGDLPDLSTGNGSDNDDGHDDGHDGPGGMPPPPPPDSGDDDENHGNGNSGPPGDDDDDDSDGHGHGGPSGGNGSSGDGHNNDEDGSAGAGLANPPGPFNFVPQDMDPSPSRREALIAARKARGMAVCENHRPIIRRNRMGNACATHAMPMLAEASVDLSAAPSTSESSASVYSRASHGELPNSSRSSSNNVASDNAGAEAESSDTRSDEQTNEHSDSAGDDADLAAMPAEHGNTGLGITTGATVHTPDEVHYYTNGTETDNVGNPLADPDDPHLADTPSHQAAAQSNDTDAANNTIVGGIPVRPGRALPDVVRRAMARSRWAN
ncbi:hypothetical protein IWZ03DRAFT_435557 [Phyllosticta citriasiana]|uniref:Uncharacterized protein n=1 Tax=Phyllosticta citriasiana TaxID=595635 RepID=A0ABR1KV41_9PEZI